MVPKVPAITYDNFITKLLNTYFSFLTIATIILSIFHNIYLIKLLKKGKN